jgi:hypothetical protein
MLPCDLLELLSSSESERDMLSEVRQTGEERRRMTRKTRKARRVEEERRGRSRRSRDIAEEE